MVNAGSSSIPIVPGITGTAGLMSDSLQNGGANSNVYPNPTGGVPSYGGDSSNSDAQSGTAGNSNQPPVEARSGAGGGGLGAATTCMTTAEVSPNEGGTTGPTPAYLGWTVTTCNPDCDDCDPCECGTCDSSSYGDPTLAGAAGTVGGSVTGSNPGPDPGWTETNSAPASF